MAKSLVNLADWMAYMPHVGWRVPRALPWLAVAASAQDSETLWILLRAARHWGNPTSPDEETLGLVLAWQDVEPALAPVAYAAGLRAVEALERQHAGTLHEAELRTLAGLRGYHLL